MNKIFRKILKNNKGGTTIMITVMIMMTILTVSFSLSNIVTNGLKVSVNQTNATKAYYAAESGAEQYLWEVRQNAFYPENGPICFDEEYVLTNFTGCSLPLNATNTFNLSNGASFYVFYEFNTPTTTVTNFGEYKGTRRAIQIAY